MPIYTRNTIHLVVDNTEVEAKEVKALINKIVIFLLHDVSYPFLQQIHLQWTTTAADVRRPGDRVPYLQRPLQFLWVRKMDGDLEVI